MYIYITTIYIYCIYIYTYTYTYTYIYIYIYISISIYLGLTPKSPSRVSFRIYPQARRQSTGILRRKSTLFWCLYRLPENKRRARSRLLRRAWRQGNGFPEFPTARDSSFLGRSGIPEGASTPWWNGWGMRSSKAQARRLHRRRRQLLLRVWAQNRYTRSSLTQTSSFSSTHAPSRINSILAMIRVIYGCSSVTQAVASAVASRLATVQVHTPFNATRSFLRVHPEKKGSP